MIILIPAYEPDHQLIKLIRNLHEADPWLTIVVVDDGSGPAYKETFDAAARLGCHVLGYPVNGGKGHALKAGFAFIAGNFPGQDVVCADSDGQHGVADILAVADRVRHVTAATVLGSRNFTGNVPARSRFGNTVTRGLFRLATGQRITDTQTGLRGYKADMVPWLLGVRGERYEYELNLLLEAKQAGYGIVSVGIATVYLNDNAGSHFRPVADSLRIYAPLLKFLASSLSAFVVDMVMFLVLLGVTDSLLVAVLGARLVSATVNFLVNRRLVFEHGKDRPLRSAATGYVALVLVLLLANYASIWALTSAAVPDLPAKILTEAGLLGVSYAVQHRFLFTRKGRAEHRETHTPALVPAQFQHSQTLKSGHQFPQRFRSNR
ncbi:bifunctional glycosyltransferase family 2/GtrA family protein [Paenarthrobacter nitroguajacolicus]|uniref:bifunctional glycosyltransferase family 2/GtrA family protein n=1 Tax=Paenarthrobacter nitroguajacolicus TaxID=211146 RepID=UPI00248D04E0|nr:bifunctional glycosyltransferase family 2/GtrA family protein [Paenarthrobacter nitroguajacolicus]MDI2034672.1 hypothetical protein [Paenarthrobacter nitroguajacolicus]